MRLAALVSAKRLVGHKGHTWATEDTMQWLWPCREAYGPLDINSVWPAMWCGRPQNVSMMVGRCIHRNKQNVSVKWHMRLIIARWTGHTNAVMAPKMASFERCFNEGFYTISIWPNMTKCMKPDFSVEEKLMCGTWSKSHLFGSLAATSNHFRKSA